MQQAGPHHPSTRTKPVALKQSHLNQLHKIIASAEKLITEIEREMQFQSGGRIGTGRSGASRGKNGGSSRGRNGRKAEIRPARGRNGSGRKAGGNGEKASRGGTSRNAGARRNRAQTAEFRQSILKELEGGMPVADLAARHGVTPAYVYQIKSRAVS
jgi:hypothetical protein